MKSKTKTASGNIIKKEWSPADIAATAISIILSLGVYGAVLYFGIIAPRQPEAVKQISELLALEEEHAEELARFGSYIVIAFLIFIFIKLIWAYFRDLGSAVSRDVLVTSAQSPDVKKTFDSYLERLPMKMPPILCLASEDKLLEVLGVPVHNKFCIRFEAFLVFNAFDSEDSSYVNYKLASELAHIYLGHYNFILFLLTYPARVIPVYKNWYYRVQNKAADIVAAKLTGTDNAVKGIIWGETDPDFAGYVLNFEEYEKEILKKRSLLGRFSRLAENLASEEAVPAYRIKYLRKAGQNEDNLPGT